MKRVNTWQDVAATGRASIDLGDGIVFQAPLDVSGAVEAVDLKAQSVVDRANSGEFDGVDGADGVNGSNVLPTQEGIVTALTSAGPAKDVIDKKLDKAAPGMANGQDLNLYTTTGNWNVQANSALTAGANYPPSATAGMLSVVARSDGASVTQRYRTYSSKRIFERHLYGGTWTAWDRVSTNVDQMFLNPKDYGVIGDGIANDTTALQAWLTAGGTRLANVTCRITSGLTLAGNARKLYTENASIIADGVGIDAITATGDDVDISVSIDGLGKARGGIKTTGARPRITRCRIENLASVGSTSRAIECTTGAGATIVGNYIRNVSAVGDSTFGNSNGMSRGVVITNTSAATGDTLIAENDISDILGEEGDAIAVLFNDGVTLLNLPCRTTIENNILRNVSRRFIKIQGGGCKVRGNVLTHNGTVPANPSNAIDFINSADGTITGNEVNDHPLLTSISVVGESDRIASGAIVADNLLRLSDTKTATSIFLNYTDGTHVSGNRIFGGGRGIAAGYSATMLIEGNTHFGGVAASKSFEANGTNTGVVMRLNTNMNAARTSYISNTGAGALTELNATRA